MKTKYVIIASVAIAIAVFAVFVALLLQPTTGRKSGPSEVQTKARELATVVRLVARDLGGRDPELPGTTRKALELVPFGTPLEAARQTMNEHQFICSVDSYTNSAQMSNSAIWNAPFVKGGERLAVTNVARLICKTNSCTLTFWLVNGETTSLSVKGEF